jgi:PRC-barrel domain
MTPMRAIMVGPLSSTTRSKGFYGCLPSSSSCSALGSFWMYSAACLSATSWRRGEGIAEGAGPEHLNALNNPSLYCEASRNLSACGNGFVNCPLLSIKRSMAMAAERETISLIGSDKVQGTAVYGADGEKIGAIERVMIEKVSGKVSYAVLSFGGFLGISDDHYPLPWPSLKYNVALGGYQTLVPVEKIKGAPKYAPSESWDWESRERARSLDDYYGVIPT